MAELVKRRCVISIGDYEPIDIEQQFANFQRELQRFGQTWNITARPSPFKVEADGAIAVCQIETEAPNWSVHTEFRQLNWSDIFEKEFRRWGFVRIWRAIKAITDFATSGTCWRSFRLNWRFGLFFFYPVIIVLFFAIAALWLATLLGNLAVPFALSLSFAIAAVLLVIFVKRVDPLALPRIISMWIILYDLVHQKRAGLAERLGVFTQDIVEKLEAGGFDEIVIVGHGLGAVIQPIIVDRALWALPKFGKDIGQSISLLSLGSLLLAVGLHPEAALVVGPVSRIARDRMIYWVEYQARTDVISFPGSNPVTEIFDQHHNTPVLQDIKFKEMIDTGAKRQFRESVYQKHRQFVQANSKKYFYDFFMVCCGPFTLSMRVEHPELMVETFYPDGRLIID